MEEKELAARAARGDEAAAERLVRLLYPGLYGCLGRLKTPLAILKAGEQTSNLRLVLQAFTGSFTCCGPARNRTAISSITPEF